MTYIPENFRDLATFNTRLLSHRFFRSVTLAREETAVVIPFLVEKSIETIIDLRADRELEIDPYATEIQEAVRYVHLPFDPWNQPTAFRKVNTYGSNVEMAYRFFSKCCKPQFRIFFETLLENQGNILFHCHSGKDRAGIMATAIHLLSGASLEVIYEDYLASKKDTVPAFIDIFLAEVETYAGIRGYLLSCGLQAKQLDQLKQLLT